MKKHILIVSQYFYPETFRINDLCVEWEKRGYKITVVTGIPNYPVGKFFQGYGINKKRHEYWNGIEIIRIPIIPRGNNALQLIFNYLSFVFSGVFFVAFAKIKVDYVFTFEVSPLTQALVGVWYAKKYKIPHYLYVQDLWPENVEIVAGVTNSIVIGAIQKMADYIYKNSKEIFATSPSFVKKIQERVEEKSKVHYWPQYAEDFYKPKKIKKTQNRNSFKIAFTGNIGYAQGLELLPRTALILKEKKANIQFYIIGDGRYRSELIRAIKKLNVESMFVLIDRQSPEKIPHYLCECNMAYISFMKSDLFSMTIPAKLQSYMACGMPIVAAASGETKRIVQEADCGIVVPEGDENMLSDAIIKFSQYSNEQLRKYGENSRKYYLEYFAKTKVMDYMEKYFFV